MRVGNRTENGKHTNSKNLYHKGKWSLAKQNQVLNFDGDTMKKAVSCLFREILAFKAAVGVLGLTLTCSQERWLFPVSPVLHLVICFHLELAMVGVFTLVNIIDANQGPFLFSRGSWQTPTQPCCFIWVQYMGFKTFLLIFSKETEGNTGHPLRLSISYFIYRQIGAFFFCKKKSLTFGCVHLCDWKPLWERMESGPRTWHSVLNSVAGPCKTYIPPVLESSSGVQSLLSSIFFSSLDIDNEKLLPTKCPLALSIRANEQATMRRANGWVTGTLNGCFLLGHCAGLCRLCWVPITALHITERAADGMGHPGNDILIRPGEIFFIYAYMYIFQYVAPYPCGNILKWITSNCEFF